MKKNIKLICVYFLLTGSLTYAQTKDQVVESILKEANQNSQLKKLAHELTDGIGPRLVGTPQMNQAHDWVINTYKDWGISAKNERWGEWRGWERGASHIDMVYPRVQSLEATQLAWSPSTSGKTITAETIILPDTENLESFQKWLPEVKGKFVMISVNHLTGRPDYNWKEFATKESYEKMKSEKRENEISWSKRIQKIGMTSKNLALALENAGAAGILTSTWSEGFGVRKIFGASTKKIPTLSIALEDYGLLYRLTESGVKPKLNVKADSKELGLVPTFNTVAEIRGTEKPEEYVVLSAHLDSWDGGTGATDNATGTITMMEAMRILKKVYPNPKRTIIAGHWGSEEQGLNGSRAFVSDHPEIVNNIQAVFNQDNGTGRVVDISGQGFLNAQEYLSRWLSAVPVSILSEIKTNFPGTPAAGGSDYASFLAAGAPAFSLSSLNWSYSTYTWHTNRDTYDKIVFDDVQKNAILTAILVYMASEDPAKTPREKSILPIDSRTGKPADWPAQREPIRKGGVD